MKFSTILLTAASTGSLASADPLCTEGASGWCSLGINTYVWPKTKGVFRKVSISDADCKKMGAKKMDHPVQQFSMASELPYTVELTIAGLGTKPEGYFWYGGKKMNFKEYANMACEDCHMGVKETCCVVQFKCL